MADTETPHTEITNPLLKWVDHRLGHHPDESFDRGLSRAEEPELLVELWLHRRDHAYGDDPHRSVYGDALQAFC